MEVEYDGVTMEANALVGDAGIPTLANTARGWLRVRTVWRLEALHQGHRTTQCAFEVVAIKMLASTASWVASNLG